MMEQTIPGIIASTEMQHSSEFLLALHLRPICSISSDLQCLSCLPWDLLFSFLSLAVVEQHA